MGFTKSYVLHVEATDKGNRVSQEPAKVEITVTSGESHPPVFNPTMYNFTVVEDVPIGTEVGRVEATVNPSSGATTGNRIILS